MARLSPSPVEHMPPLGIELEQQRLAHRALRIRRALAAMRRLADARHGDVPRPLRSGINDFNRELVTVERRLRELSAR